MQFWYSFHETTLVQCSFAVVYYETTLVQCSVDVVYYETTLVQWNYAKPSKAKQSLAKLSKAEQS